MLLQVEDEAREKEINKLTDFKMSDTKPECIWLTWLQKTTS